MSEHQCQYTPETIIEAGRSAYRLLVPRQNNPYRINSKRYSDLWDKGWRLERRRYDGPRGRLYTATNTLAYQELPQRSRRPPLRFRRPDESSSVRIDVKRFERFNQRNRTAA